jgi:hypothetical protein
MAQQLLRRCRRIRTVVSIMEAADKGSEDRLGPWKRFRWHLWALMYLPDDLHQFSQYGVVRSPFLLP